MTAAQDLPPELLAPAGDWDALRAAVAGGADAVYFGLGDFNARRRATNFTLAELPRVMDHLHGRNVKGYIAFNTLIFPAELPVAAEYAAAIARAGADAVIVQDLGLAAMIHRMAPSLPLHASTQMTLSEPRAIVAAGRLGVRRVILPRELSLEQIAVIAGACPEMELEVFVHGALCVSYSGQCLASESIWGRSANRGLCMQACRLPYELVVDGEVADLGERKYLLSPLDLAAYDLVGELVRIGVRGFKIEGRLKSAAYVAAATRTYRAALDAASAGQPFRPTPRQERELAQSFSRGFTHGYLDGTGAQGLVEGLFPKSRGIRIGTIAGVTPRGVVVELSGSDSRHGAAELPLRPGDGVVFDEGHPERDEQGGRVYEVREMGAGRIEIAFGRGDVSLSAVAVGSVVWKTDDPQLRRELEKTLSQDEAVRRVPVRARVTADRTLEVVFRDDAGHEGAASWLGPLAPAEKHPLTTDLLRLQLGRLGDTPLELAEVELRGAGGAAESLPVMVPKSVLNDFRRRAAEQLLSARAAGTRHAVVEADALERCRREARERAASLLPSLASRLSWSLAVLVRSPEQLAAVLEWRPPHGLPRPELVYYDTPEAAEYKDAMRAGSAAGVAVGLAAPRILKPGEEELLARIAECAPAAVLVRNLGSINFFRQRIPQVPLVGDHSLNAANELSAELLLRDGLSRLTPNHDLNWRQLASMLECVPPALVEVVIHQHVPMFHLEHCVAAARLSDRSGDSGGRNSRDCGRPCRRSLRLRDRIGAEHPLRRETACRSTVFSARAQSAARLLAEMRAAGLQHFRVELTDEPPADATAILECYLSLLAGRQNAETAWRRLQSLCGQGLYQGTLDFE